MKHAQNCRKIPGPLQAGIAMLVLLLTASFVRAATVTWIATGTNDWFNTNNWSSTNIPAAGDDVRITSTNVGVLLTNSAPAAGWLSSFTISNRATLIFSNWNTTLSATNMIIGSNGVLTLPAAFTNDQMSNNVCLACSNLTIASNGWINADGLGYAGRVGMNGSGPGGGTALYMGGSYGGAGGYGGSLIYGSSNAPTAPGSAGGGGSIYAGSAGGGAVFIQASGVITNNGIITANGAGGGSLVAGAGSGGGIYIVCSLLAGSGGVIRANGGAGGSGSGYSSGGGGGRVAVNYDTNAQGSIPPPSILFQASGGYTPNVGSPPSSGNFGNAGTLYFPDNRFLAETFAHAGQWSVPGFTNWAPNNLLISTNCWLKIPADGFQLMITNSLTITGTNGYTTGLELNNGSVTCGGSVSVSNATLGLYGSTNTPGSSLNCGSNLTLANGALLYVYSGLTNNASGTNWGALVSVTNDLWMATNATIHLYSQTTNGGSPLLRMRNLTMTNGASINANGRGYKGTTAVGYGPGAGNNQNVGGGYGGKGGGATTNYGITYGNSNAPIDPGSAGGGQSGYTGGYGGGLIRIEAADTATFGGTLLANGGGGSYTAAGSGGGIYITCRTLAGSGGSLSANGGSPASTYPGGGGGRIAVWRMWDTFAGSVSVMNGTNGSGATNNYGQLGTIVWGQLPIPGTIIKMH